MLYFFCDYSLKKQIKQVFHEGVMAGLHSRLSLLSFLVKDTRRMLGPTLKEFGQATARGPKYGAFPMLRDMKVETTVREGGASPSPSPTTVTPCCWQPRWPTPAN